MIAPHDDDPLRAFENGEIDRATLEARLRRDGWCGPLSRVDFPNDLQLDVHRSDRTGEPEVVFGEGKSNEQLVRAFTTLHANHGRALATRVSAERWAEISAEIVPIGAVFESLSRTICSGPPADLVGHVAILSAGTSDSAVAEEAAVAARFMGTDTTIHHDVGVAGLERVFRCATDWQAADAIVIVAGMDGALPSVVAGRTDRPIVAVPTSVGYGASFEGLAPLLTMLNACAPGVAVVNIDNGFGAGILASRISRRAHQSPSPHASSGPARPDGKESRS